MGEQVEVCRNHGGSNVKGVEMIKLDEYDLKLINLLRNNARLSISELAKLLGLSRPTVKARLERLEKKGIIQKYTVKLSPEIERAGNLVILIVETDNPEILHEIEEVVEINKITSRKYVIEVLVDRIDELKGAIDRSGMEVLEIMPVLERQEREIQIKMKIPFKCDYCGKELTEEPIIYKYHNKIYFFCCGTCFDEFKGLEEE